MDSIYKNEAFLTLMVVMIIMAIIFLLAKSIIKFIVTTILIFVIFFGVTQCNVILEKYGDKLTPTEKTFIQKIGIGIDNINRDKIDSNIDKINKLVDDSDDKIKQASDIIEQSKSYNNQ